MAETLGVGVVGIGFGQAVHVPVFKADPRCEVVAIAATSAERASKIAGTLGVRSGYGDWRQLLADPRVDIVSIAVPPIDQPAIAEAAAAMGKHLFCEKPIASSVEPARQMVERVAASGVHHAVDFLFPEIAEFREARDLIGSERIGKLRHVDVTWHVEIYAQRNPESVSWKRSVASGGGAIHSFFSHVVHYVEWLAGRVSRVLCKTVGDDQKRAMVWLDMESGASATVSIVTDAVAGTGHRVALYGDGGSVVIENATRDYASGFQIRIASRDGVLARDAGRGDRGGDGRIAAMSRIAGRFVDAIEGGQSVTPNLHHAYRVAVVCDAAEKSAASSTWKVPHDDRV